jgi:putative flippase GtrA
VTRRVLARQGFAFILVGAIATAVHVVTALAAHHLGGIEPLPANFIGYVCAVGVSYLGNARFTFGRPALHGGRFVRFAVISASGLAANQAITWLLVGRLGLPFWAGLAVVVVVVPALSFVAARLWAFRTRG